VVSITCTAATVSGWSAGGHSLKLLLGPEAPKVSMTDNTKSIIIVVSFSHSLVNSEKRFEKGAGAVRNF
jgi:hypothetical protein